MGNNFSCKLPYYRCVLTFLAAMLIFSGTASADTYYVSTTGSDSNSGTIDYPFESLTAAMSAASAGDTIYLREGTYDFSSKLSISESGTSSAMITVSGYAGETAVLDFSGTSTGTRGIELSGNYWHLYNFIVQNAGDNGIYITGTNNIVELIVTRYNQDSGIQLHTGAADNLILNCDSYLNYDPSNHGENADGFATKFGLGIGNILRDCRAWSNSDDGYDCWNSNPPSEAVTFDGCRSFRNGIDHWNEGSSFAGDGNGFKLGAGAGAHLLINCVAYDNPHNGIDVNGNTTGVHVYNCNAIMNGTSSGTNFRFDEYNSAHVLRNNLSYPASEIIYDDIDDEYNSWNGFTVSESDFVSLDPTGIDGPRQADGSLPESSFMQLAAGSSLIDSGIDVGLPYEGSAPDLGACEFTGQEYPPAAPTGLAASIGCEKVALDWDDNGETDITGYNVYRSTTPSGTYTIAPNASGLTASDYTDTDVVYTTTYYYVVTAINESLLESAYSDQVSARPTVYGDFIVNRAVDDADLDYLAALWLDDDCQLTGSADLGDDCIVNLTEFAAFAQNFGFIEQDTAPPSAPTALAAYAGDLVVTLDWNDSTEEDLDGYNVYRSLTSGGDYELLNDTIVTASEYTDDTVANGTTYYYIVTAVDASSNESYDSNEAFATPTVEDIEIIIQEYETGFCSLVSDAEIDGIDSDHSGYTGDGFTNTANQNGAGINYSVNILTPGTYAFIWKYASASGNRTANLIIDGSVEAAVDFPASGDWTAWVDTTGAEITLTAGMKEIRLEATTSSGLANIDYMQVTGPNLEAAACP